jgi:hypothetical protein
MVSLKQISFLFDAAGTAGGLLKALCDLVIKTQSTRERKRERERERERGGTKKGNFLALWRITLNRHKIKLPSSRMLKKF